MPPVASPACRCPEGYRDSDDNTKNPPVARLQSGDLINKSLQTRLAGTLNLVNVVNMATRLSLVSRPVTNAPRVSRLDRRESRI